MSLSAASEIALDLSLLSNKAITTKSHIFLGGGVKKKVFINTEVVMKLLKKIIFQRGGQMSRLAFISLDGNYGSTEKKKIDSYQ